MNTGLAITVFAAAGTLAVAAGVLMCKNGRLAAQLQDERDENKSLTMQAQAAADTARAAQSELDAFFDHFVGGALGDDT